MKINEMILKNEELASCMQLYADQIHRLEKLIELTEQTIPDQPGGSLAGPLRRQLKKHKEHFTFLNDAYDQRAHDNRDKNTKAFISETVEGITEIGITFSRLALK